MKKAITILTILITAVNMQAQQFIDKAAIEFEVKTNIKKTIGTGTWAEMMGENLPQFKTGYYQFSFSGNKSIYKFDHWTDGQKVPEFMRKDDEQDIYYFDHSTKKMYQQKAIVGSNFYVEDSVVRINWRLTNESRVIAGFNCRKAVGVIMDSVYVFAFYTDEILIPGGPCSISGLPGMILGLTIPRLYTSFIATRVKLSGINEEELKPIAAKKYSDRASLRKLITERAKEWGGGSDDENARSWLNQFVWGALL